MAVFRKSGGSTAVPSQFQMYIIKATAMPYLSAVTPFLSALLYWF